MALQVGKAFSKWQSWRHVRRKDLANGACCMHTHVDRSIEHRTMSPARQTTVKDECDECSVAWSQGNHMIESSHFAPVILLPPSIHASAACAFASIFTPDRARDFCSTSVQLL